MENINIDEIKKYLRENLRDEILLENNMLMDKNNYVEGVVTESRLSEYNTLTDFLDSTTKGVIFNNVNSRIKYSNQDINISSEYFEIDMNIYQSLNVNIYALLITLSLDDLNGTYFFIDQFASSLFNYCHSISEVYLMENLLDDMADIGQTGRKMKLLLSNLIVTYREQLLNSKSRDEQRNVFEIEINKVRKKTKSIEK